MGVQRHLPLLSLLLNILRQIDRGVDYEHQGDGIDVLINTFSTSNPHSLLIACICPTTPAVYRRRLNDQKAYNPPRRGRHATGIMVHVYKFQGLELQRQACLAAHLAWATC